MVAKAISMHNAIASLDHPIIAVASLDASRAAYERLGFVVQPRGSHVEWGTGNGCVMFERDYLELRGVIDAELFTMDLDKHLAEHGEGLLGDKSHSMIFDNSKIKRLAPGFVCTIPFAWGAREIVTWHEAASSRQVVDPHVDALIERVLAAYGAVWP